jgi:branched-chain amino acid transport system substrate-binding protein
MTARWRRYPTALFVVLLFVTVLASCSNDDNSSAKSKTDVTSGKAAGSGATDPAAQFAGLKHVDEPSPCTNDPGITDTEIKLGGIAPESGPLSISFQPAEIAWKARIEKANQEKELGDRKITLKTIDDGGDIARNTEAARQLVESEKVFAVLSMSDKADGSAKYLNEKGVPVVGWAVGRPVWSIYPNMFAMRAPTSRDPEKDYTSRNADLLKTLGATKVALIGGINQASATFISKLKRSIEQFGQPMQVVYVTTDVAPESREFTPIIQRIKESGADALYTGVDLVQNAAISDQLAKAGVSLKAIVFPGGYDPRVLALPGLEGATFGIEFFPFELNTPSYQEFNKWMPAGAPRGQVTYIGWLSAEQMIQGLKEAGLKCPTQKAFITNLRLVKNYTANGAYDPVNFTDVFGKEFQCVYYVKVINKKFVPQFDGKQFCGKPVTLK